MTASSDDSNDLDSLIEQRRKTLEDPLTPQAERWGLALSGGGIRSSVFCYGLISALAKSKAFWRFDLMSTVSGGGYIGSMVGRLAQRAESAADLQEQLGELGPQSHHRSWLRANSRYLTPRGSRDRLFAVVIFLRNLAGVHLELGFLGVLLGCVLGSIDVFTWWGMNAWMTAYPNALGPGGALKVWNVVSMLPTLWLLLPLPILWGAGAVIVYWYMPTTTGRHEVWDMRSSKVTRHLVWSVRIGFIILMLGVIDWIAWRLAKQPALLLQLGGFFAFILAVLRLLLPMIQQNGQTAGDLLRQKLPAILDWAGRFGLLILGIFWVSLVHAFATHEVWKSPQVDYVGALWALSIPLFVSLFWISVSRTNLDFLNRSSLHNFYRSRLNRAYLGAANPARANDSNVTEVDDGDDIALNLYQPHATGGPVHIINVCVNQTYQREGLYNIDRQGDNLSIVGPGMFQIRQGGWKALRPQTLSTLATWMAISGAAAAPGMGTLTRPGIASMLTTLGVRLGYWWRADDPDLELKWIEKCFPKYCGLISELVARFAGSRSNLQYLSDGGHSENTGAYPLLEAKCKLIILADAAADPAYQFGDLENLIRRARIDLNVNIRFIKPKSALFGSIDDLVDPALPACLALARIDYPGDSEPGVLILVKPNLTPGLPEDVYNYSRDNPKFPQETTVDQFFDEAQWESYFSLGCHLGSALDEPLLLSLKLTPLPGASVPIHRPLSSSAKSQSSDPPAVDAAAASRTAAVPAQQDTDSKQRRPKRISTKSAAAAGIGLGAIISSASALWVGFNSSQGEKETEYSLKPLYETYGALPNIAQKDTTQAVGLMATKVLAIKRTTNTDEFQALFDRDLQAMDMLRATYGLCRTLSGEIAACRTLLGAIECPVPTEVSPVNKNDGYWARTDGSEQRLERKDPLCESEEVAAIAPVVLAEPSATEGGVTAAPSGPVTEGTVMAAPPPPAEDTGQTSVCAGITIFTQIYSPDGRDKVRTLRALWRSAGASVPPIEDVSASSRRQGRSAPDPYDKPTVIYHREDALECANALPGLAFQADRTWEVVPMNRRLTRVQKTIEVWLPPTAVTAGFAQWADHQGYCYQEVSTGETKAELYGVHCHPSRLACEDARGANSARKQSSCMRVELKPQDPPLLPMSGWAGSRYNLGTTPFGAPFPEVR